MQRLENDNDRILQILQKKFEGINKKEYNTIELLKIIDKYKDSDLHYSFKNLDFNIKTIGFIGKYNKGKESDIFPDEYFPSVEIHDQYTTGDSSLYFQKIPVVNGTFLQKTGECEKSLAKDITLCPYAIMITNQAVSINEEYVK
jgi:hypothetical protein